MTHLICKGADLSMLEFKKYEDAKPLIIIYHYCFIRLSKMWLKLIFKQITCINNDHYKLTFLTTNSLFTIICKKYEIDLFLFF